MDCITRVPFSNTSLAGNNIIVRNYLVSNLQNTFNNTSGFSYEMPVIVER
jgi:hypothetical protein